MIRAALLAAVAACSPATALHRTALITEIAAEGSLLCDAGSTRAAVDVRSPGSTTGWKWEETNPVMGVHPSGGDEIGYFSAVGAGVAAANYAFAHGQNHVAGDVWRVLTNLAVIGVEIDAVQSNTSLGVAMCGV